MYTGTKFQGRKELNKLIKQLKTGDTVVFDSVSRMSRDAEEGFQVYQDLYKKVMWCAVKDGFKRDFSRKHKDILEILQLVF